MITTSKWVFIAMGYLFQDILKYIRMTQTNTGGGGFIEIETSLIHPKVEFFFFGEISHRCWYSRNFNFNLYNIVHIQKVFIRER